MSEYAHDEEARPHYFLERNRIVSGLADAIITEAAARSGTLNTATHALEQGKAIFVVPGNITSPLSAGCNALLKQGATPISGDCARLTGTANQARTGSTPLETTIISLLQSGIRDGDTLLQASEVGPTDFATALTMLEIAGTVRSLGANQWTLK